MTAKEFAEKHKGRRIKIETSNKEYIPDEYGRQYHYGTTGIIAGYNDLHIAILLDEKYGHRGIGQTIFQEYKSHSERMWNVLEEHIIFLDDKSKKNNEYPHIC